MKTKEIELNQNLLKEYFRLKPVIRAYIFGSTARGDNNADSDIDILVELEKKTDLFQFVGIKLELEKLLNKTVDLVSADGISPRMKSRIDKEKILIYEK